MIFSVTNQKGGVGKTTTALNLGVYLAAAGKRVLMVDIDPQANLTSGLGMKEEYSKEHKQSKRKSIYDVLVNSLGAQEAIMQSRLTNLWLLPSSIELAGAEIEIVNALSRETILKRALQSVHSQFDYILIDCSPSLGLLTLNALTATDKVIIPVQAEYFALEGLGQLISTIKLVKENLNNGLDIGGVILTMFDTRTNLSKDVAMELKEFFANKLFDTVVPRNVKLSEAPSHGLSIREYDPQSTGAQAYERLSEEFIKRFN